MFVVCHSVTVFSEEQQNAATKTNGGFFNQLNEKLLIGTANNFSKYFFFLTTNILLNFKPRPHKRHILPDVTC